MTAAPPTLWVRSELLPNGTYGVGLNVGEDRAWVLPPDAAIRYAVTCFARATEAEHDAAMVNMLIHLGIDRPTAAQMIMRDLWPDRPVDHSATEPLRLWTALMRDGSPVLKLDLDGKLVGQVSSRDIADHAAAVLRVIAVADLDAAAYRFLNGRAGIPEDNARAAIHALMDHWPTGSSP